MIEAMRRVGLLYLQHKCGDEGQMSDLRQSHQGEVFSCLLEPSEKIQRVYILTLSDDDLVKMRVEDLDDRKRKLLPFVKPTGSQSPAVGPVIKRTTKGKKYNKTVGPTGKIQKTTLKSFDELSKSKDSWHAYFAYILRVLGEGKRLRFQEQECIVGGKAADKNILAAAIRLIPEEETVFLTVEDDKKCLPGEVNDYLQYLARYLAEQKYVTAKAKLKAQGTCPICGQMGVNLYPNALKGAGINFGNVDREGAFPERDIRQAWKSFGLCLDCADLLYIFKYHSSTDFVDQVAGEKALILPDMIGGVAGQQAFMRDFEKYVKRLQGDKTGSHEKDLLEFFLDSDDSSLVVHILWAEFGQNIANVKGLVTDVLPSRLQALVRLNNLVNNSTHKLFAPLDSDETPRYDLALSPLKKVFSEPRKDKKRKKTDTQYRKLKLQVASCLYRGEAMREQEKLFWLEVISVARSYIHEAIQQRNSDGLIYQIPKAPNRLHKPTLACWVRYLARVVYYMRLGEVLPMVSGQGTRSYNPETEILKDYFSEKSGIDSNEKAFAFLLGVLFGKLVQVQAAKKISVVSNALTWLKSLRLDGRDLPELYNKIREKLMYYQTDGNEKVKAVIHELGRLGLVLGDTIKLDTVSTCYFLLLGQSVAVDILPARKEGDSTDE